MAGLITHGGGSLIDRAGGGTGLIPELTSDPASPTAEEAWVLKSGGGGSAIAAGQPIGLLAALTYALASSGGSAATYQFSYQTLEGPIIRATLS